MKLGTKMLSAVTAGLVLAASLAGCSSGAGPAAGALRRWGCRYSG